MAKSEYREKCMALNAYIRKAEISKLNYLSFYLKKLEKEEQIIHQADRRNINKDQNENQ